MTLSLLFLARRANKCVPPPVTFSNDFEAPIVKGTIDPASPFTALSSGETWGAVYYEGGTYYLYCGLAAAIGVRTSADGKTWGERTEVLARSAADAWDYTNCYCPTVWKEGATYYMLYGGYSADSTTKVGLATSASPTEGWTRYEGNPVYDNQIWSHSGAEPWGLIKIGATYHLWVNNYGGSGLAPNGVGERQTGLVTSTDLIHWTADPSNPIYVGQRYCPCIWHQGRYYYMLVTHQITGVDYANLEIYRSLDPRFLPDRRRFLGSALYTPQDATTADGGDLDTPLPVMTGPEMEYLDDPLPIYYAVQSQAGAWKMGLFHLPMASIADGALLADTFTATHTPSAAWSLSTDAAKVGAQSLKCAVTAANENYRVGVGKVRGSIAFWLRQETGMTTTFYGYGDGKTEAIVFQTLASRKWQYKDGATATAGTTIRTAGAWYHVEITFDCAAGIWGYETTTADGTAFESRAGLAMSADVDSIAEFYVYRPATRAQIMYLDYLRIPA